MAKGASLVWFGITKELREFLSAALIDASDGIKAKGHGGRPSKDSTAAFANDEREILLQEILEDVCAGHICSECSVNGGCHDPAIFEILRELPNGLNECPMPLQRSFQYREWVNRCLDELYAIPEGAGCVSLRRLRSNGVSLPWAFLMTYMYLLFVLADVKDQGEVIAAPGMRETTKAKAAFEFFDRRIETQKQLRSVYSALEAYKGCCSTEEKYQFIHPEHLGEIHEIRRRLLCLAESALVCCRKLDQCKRQTNAFFAAQATGVSSPMR